MSNNTKDRCPFPGRLSHLVRVEDFKGFGFNLHTVKGRTGQFIGVVDDDSPASVAGLRHGDRVVEVNGVNVATENHKQVVARIKLVPDETRLLVVDAACDAWHQERNIVVSGAMTNVVHASNGRRRTSSGGDSDVSDADRRSVTSDTSNNNQDIPPVQQKSTDEESFDNASSASSHVYDSVIQEENEEELLKIGQETDEKIVGESAGKLTESSAILREVDEDSDESSSAIVSGKKHQRQRQQDDDDEEEEERDAFDSVNNTDDQKFSSNTVPKDDQSVSSEEDESATARPNTGVKGIEQSPSSSSRSSSVSGGDVVENGAAAAGSIKENGAIAAARSETENIYEDDFVVVDKKVENNQNEHVYENPKKTENVYEDQTETTQKPNFISASSPVSDTPSPPSSLGAPSPTPIASNNYSRMGGLNMNMTAAEMRALLASKKKKDIRHSVQMDLRQKYDIVQRL